MVLIRLAMPPCCMLLMRASSSADCVTLASGILESARKKNNCRIRELTIQITEATAHARGPITGLSARCRGLARA